MNTATWAYAATVGRRSYNTGYDKK